MTGVPRLDVQVLTELTTAQADEVRGLAAAAARADGVSALSEQTLLSLAPGRGASATSASAPGDAAPQGSGAPGAGRHYLGYAAGRLRGYAQADGHGPDASVELVVDPQHRREGVGGALWYAVSSAHPQARVWAHGNLPPAQAFAARLGLSPVRELHKMSRPLTPQDADPAGTVLPDGFTARAFVPGQDDAAWVDANAAAFASHPEQGRMTVADLHERMAQEWFDPEGFIIVEHSDAPARVAAFHWTKVDPAERSSIDPSHLVGRAHMEEGREASHLVGEVYVLGVHPAYQGRGLGRPLTALGLAHLARLGLPEVVLYVDGDNAAALRTYTGLGFHSIMVDVMYSGAIHPQVSG
jgi:mycothiol synthase